MIMLISEHTNKTPVIAQGHVTHRSSKESNIEKKRTISAYQDQGESGEEKSK